MENLVDPHTSPKVLFTYPALNSVGPYSEWEASNSYYSTLPFEVRFNKLMMPASVRRSLSLRSSQRALLIDTNAIYSSSRETYRFALYDPYFTPKSYRLGEILTLSFSQPVADVNGNLIPAGDLGTFLPEPTFRVRWMSPPDGSQLYPSNAYSLILAFNSKIDASVLPFVSLVPASVRSWKISADSTSLSTTIAISGPTQEYRVRVDAAASDRYGNRSESSFSGRITAAPFVDRNYFYDYDTIGVPLYRGFYLSFTYQLDTTTIRPAFHILPPVAGGISFSPYFGSFDFPFRPTVEFAPNTRYTIRIDTTLLSQSGFHLSKEYTFAFQTGPFTVMDAYPPDQSTGVSRNTSVSMSWSGILDTASVRQSFSIVPATPGTLYLSVGSTGFIFYPANGFLANTIYTVTVNTSIRSVGGYMMSEPYTFTFTTGP